MQGKGKITGFTKVSPGGTPGLMVSVIVEDHRVHKSTSYIFKESHVDVDNLLVNEANIVRLRDWGCKGL